MRGRVEFGRFARYRFGVGTADSGTSWMGRRLRERDALDQKATAGARGDPCQIEVSVLTWDFVLQVPRQCFERDAKRGRRQVFPRTTTSAETTPTPLGDEGRLIRAADEAIRIEAFRGSHARDAFAEQSRREDVRSQASAGIGDELVAFETKREGAFGKPWVRCEVHESSSEGLSLVPGVVASCVPTIETRAASWLREGSGLGEPFRNASRRHIGPGGRSSMLAPPRFADLF